MDEPTSIPELMQELHEKETSLRPDDVPEDIWDDARKALSLNFIVPIPSLEVAISVARALMAGREADAAMADHRAAICADAVAKIDAGQLYKNSPTARATEDCARMEAEHIARLIRRDPGAILVEFGKAPAK